LSGAAGDASSAGAAFSSPFGASTGRGCGKGIFPDSVGAMSRWGALRAQAGAPDAASTSRMTVLAIADCQRKKRQ
jgi:hypothetical protein